MEILDLKVTCGPNYWSVKRHRLVVMHLDIKELEKQPTDEIESFYPRIKKVFPGLYEHQCSEGVPGGFFKRLKRGTWMGHVVEHIAIELQILAGLEVGFGKTRGTGINGQYYVVFECADGESGLLTAKKAVKIVHDLIDGIPVQTDQHVKEIRRINLKHMPGPSTSSLLQEAASRNIPSIKLEDSTYQLGYGCFQKKIAATITSSTSNIAVELSCDKEACRNLFQEMSIPVPEGDVVSSVKAMKSCIEEFGFPLVIKPVSGNKGRGVSTQIKTLKQAEEAFSLATEISEKAVVERYIPGNDYRLLMVNHKLVAAAKRVPAHITGDGESTIEDLIKRVNEDPCRGAGHEKILTKITIGHNAKSILSENDLTPQSVLSSGKTLYLDHAANLSKGGTAEDVTDCVHPQVTRMAERISRLTGLDICGIDIIAPSLEQPLTETGGVVLEVNAAPGFRMHLAPTKGKSRNVAAPVLDMLFPKDTKSRIPIIAITGTNGKTTTTRLISHIMKISGRRVGMTSTDGVYVNDVQLMKGDCGGPKSALAVLKDPTVDTAVLECARGGILRSGLGFDQCDTAVVTNVSSDHLGMNGIQRLDQMASLKSVVPESVHPSGFAVLNADDNRVFAMRKNLQCNVVLFSMDAENPRVLEHRESGGMCVVYKDRQIIIWDGHKTTIVEKIENIPLSYNGRAGFMIENILAAVGAAYTQKISISDLRKSLAGFKPSPEQIPGRLNLFSFEHYDVLVDYAHNPAGLNALKHFIDNSSYPYKIGIVCGLGDRRDEDNREIGRLSAEIFDKVIIREDADLRGKEPGEAIEIVKQGIASSPHDPEVIVIPNARKALLFALENELTGSLITMCVENIDEAISIVKAHQEKLKNKKPQAAVMST